MATAHRDALVACEKRSDKSVPSELVLKRRDGFIASCSNRRHVRPASILGQLDPQSRLFFNFLLDFSQVPSDQC